MNLTLKTQSGAEYKRVAWMGGSTPPPDLHKNCRDYRDLVTLFYEEQVSDFSDYWGDMPDKDTKNIFMGRARGDAWATYRDKIV